MADKLNIKLKDLPEKPIDETKSVMDTEPIVEVELPEESNDGKVYNSDQESTQPELTMQSESELEIEQKAEPLDLLKSALTLIIAKAEAIDINVDKPKLLGKLKGALEILNKN